jgi:hypothetical protein
MDRLPAHLIQQNINALSASSWNMRVTFNFQEEQNVDLVGEDERYTHYVGVFLRVPNTMCLFYGGDPMSHLADFRRVEWLDIDFTEEVKENRYGIKFEDSARMELNTEGDGGGDMIYVISFEYTLDAPLDEDGGLDEDGEWHPDDYRNILDTMKFHAASLMAHFCRRYLPSPTQEYFYQTRMWKLQNSLCRDAAWWRCLFASRDVGLIPVINNTVVRLGNSWVLNETNDGVPHVKF